MGSLFRTPVSMIIDPVTGEKLDKKLSDINSSLADMATNVVSFGAKGDGVTDDTTAIQNTLNYARDNNLKKVIAAKKTYYVTAPIDLPSNVEFDGNGSTFIFENVSNTVINPQDIRQSWRGVFNVWGSETTTKVNITGYDSGIFNFDTPDSGKINNNTGRWTVSNASGFARGDFVKIEVPFRSQAITEYHPVAMVLARVEAVDVANNYIYTDYYSPFNWSGYSFRTDVDVIVKVNVKENVKISNIKVYDKSTADNRATVGVGAPDTPNRDKRPCGIGLMYAHNLMIENVKFENFVFCGITHRYTHTYHVDGLEMIRPAGLGPGEGYATQNNQVMNGVIERVRSIGTVRHLVDFSGAYFCKVRDCNGSSTRNAAFDLHGLGEHDIEFDQCVGTFGFSNGLNAFNEVGHNIVVRRSKGTINGMGYITNLVFEDSDLFITSGTVADRLGTNYNTNYAPQVTFKDCKITLNENSNNIVSLKRGQSDITWMKFYNCNFSGYRNTTTRIIFLIQDYDNVTFKDCTVEDMKAWNVIEVMNAKNATVESCTITDSIIMFTSNTSKMINHKFKKNTIRMTDAINSRLYSNYNFIVRADRLSNLKGVFDISENTVVSERTTGSNQYFVLIGSADNTGSTVDVLLRNNILKADVSGKLSISIHKDSVCKITTSNNLRDASTVSVYPTTSHINVEDDYVRSQRKRLVLSSPNGTNYQLNVGDTGTVGTTSVT